MPIFASKKKVREIASGRVTRVASRIACIVLIVLFALVCVLLGSCVADNVVPSWQAQKRVNAAYFAKLKQCDQTLPFFIILVPNDVQEPDVRLCEAEVLAAKCPVENMPASCLLLMIKKAPNKDFDGV